jgi:phosphoribosyl-AMP cyclohydrolase
VKNPLQKFRRSCSTEFAQAEDACCGSGIFFRVLLLTCNNRRMSGAAAACSATFGGSLRTDIFKGAYTVTDQALTTGERESGTVFAPKFDANGLLTAVVTDAASGRVLVVAHMNAEALEATLSSGRVHFWSRSRQSLWMKGETSGHVLEVAAILVDCDQDALVIAAHPAGPTCHTGANSCFYRRLAMRDGAPVLVKVNT